ncbi:hypothetical protein [Senegalia massiliensis]|uniref:Uncharacterized protein n=1 Tax=Senegalia massiliensis TaxID=1720316 RepID=A0A845R290_9CLOT|nr:hypothetical protein [Senegalia massiliensis]NBI07542.1 hypothetical protein [Senegalia massiliensis]
MKNTPARFIMLAIEQYIRASDYTLKEVLSSELLRKERALASAFALKEYSVIALKESNLSYEYKDGDLSFYLHGMKVCDIDSDSFKAIEVNFSNGKNNVYQDKELSMRIEKYSNDDFISEQRIYAFNLLCELHKIEKGIDNLGLSDKDRTEIEQIKIA